jgi:hypothetical protein
VNRPAHSRIFLLAVAGLLVTVQACTGDGGETTTTTSAEGGAVTSAPGSDAGSTTTSPENSTTTLRGQVVDQFRQAHSEEATGGDIVHLVIPRAGYTDIDIENFLRELRQASPGLWGVELFDSDEAQQAFMVPEGSRTEEQRTLISRHHLASLVDGDLLVWRGPFASLGQVILGS